MRRLEKLLVPRDAESGPLSAWLARLLLIGILVLHVTLTFQWMRDNGYLARPPVRDGAHLRMQVIPMYEALEKDGVFGLIRAVVNHPDHVPPLVHMVAAIMTRLSGIRDINMTMLWRTMAFFWVIQGLGIYRLARNFGSRWVAVGAVAIACSCPVIITWMRPYYRQMPMTAILVWSLDALIRSDLLTRRRWAILGGFFFGTAMLAKELVPVYAGGACVLAVLLGLRFEKGRRKEVLINAGLFNVFVLLPMSVWYLEHWRLVADYTGRVTGDAGQALYSVGIPIWSLQRWIYYPTFFVTKGFGFVLTLVAVLAWGLVRRHAPHPAPPAERRDVRFAGPLLFAAIAVTYPVITIGQTEGEATFLDAMMPAAAIGLAVNLAAIHVRRIAWFARILCFGACLWQIHLSYRSPEEDRVAPDWTILRMVDRTDSIISSNFADMKLTASKDAEPWPNGDFAEKITETADQPMPRLGILPRLHCAYCDPFHIAYRGWRLGWDFVPTQPTNTSTLLASFVDLMDHTDYLIISSVPVLKKDNATREELQAVIDQATLPLDILDSRVVTPTTTIHLLRVKRPWNEGMLRPRTILASAAVQPKDATFDNGWHVLGYQYHLIDPAHFAVTTYWDLKKTGPDGIRMVADVIYDPDVKPLRWTIDFAKPPKKYDPEEQVLAITSDALPLPPGFTNPLRIHVGLEMRDKSHPGAPAVRAKIESKSGRAEQSFVIKF